MSKNFLKIEMINSKPIISLEYDSLESFQHLMFCLLSPQGFELVYKTLQKQLIENDKKEEVESLSIILELLNKENEEKLVYLDSKKVNLINPSSFK